MTNLFAMIDLGVLCYIVLSSNPNDNIFRYIISILWVVASMAFGIYYDHICEVRESKRRYIED